MASSTDRLLALPAVFSLDMLCKQGMTRHSANILLMRLSAQGRVAHAGQKSGVYFNLVVDRDGPDNRKLEAVKLAYPSAVVVGAAVLHAHGWTTQIPTSTDVAILKLPSVRSFFGLNIVQRPKSWYQQFTGEILAEGESPFQIDSLKPLAALKDIELDPELWRPDPDDLDIPDDVGYQQAGRTERFRS